MKTLNKNHYTSILFSLALISLLSLDSDQKKPETAIVSQEKQMFIQNEPLPQLHDSALINEFKIFSLHIQKQKSIQKKDEQPKKFIFPKHKTNQLVMKDNISPILTVKLEKNTLLALNIGNIFRLPDIGEVPYYAEIKERKLHLDGTISIIGDIEDEYENYSTVITLGKKNSFATFHTPEGSFELEGDKELGYIYAIKEIDQQWIDYEKEDTLLLGSS